MNDEFIHWDNLDLEDVLGSGNWTDKDESVIWGRESEWDSDDVGSVDMKENRAKTSRRSVAKNTTKNFKCPLCIKQYTSTSRFRGHVIKKHNRPDIKAHLNQINVGEVTGLPEEEVPLTTPSAIENNMPEICRTSLENIKTDGFHTSSFSKSGSSLVMIATRLLASNLVALNLMLLSYLSPIFTIGLHQDSCALLTKVSELRMNTIFLDTMATLIKGSGLDMHMKFFRFFSQRLITNIVLEYFRLQNNLMCIQEQSAATELSENDKQVIYYICGYIVHALKKRYYRNNTHTGNKWSKLLSLTEKLQIQDGLTSSLPVQWTEILDRGGLKKPNAKFFSIMLQIERWIREVSQINALHSDSLVALKAKLLDYNLLKLSWRKLITEDDDMQGLILEHVLSLFLKVRGFAITKHVRKQLQKKRKNTRVAAGSEKALRKQLKQMSTV